MNQKQKTLTITIIAIATMLLVVAGATYAYFSSSTNINDGFPVNTQTAGSMHTLTAVANESIVHNLSASMMQESMVNESAISVDNANIEVELKSANDDTKTTCTYDIVWIWDSADVYTIPSEPLPITEDGKTYNYEFSVYIDGLMDTEKDLSELKTYDKGLIIYEGASITANTTTGTKEKYTIDSHIYNLPVDQTALFNKHFEAHIGIDNVNCQMESTKSSIAMMVYDENVGDYVSQTTIPKGDYVINEEKSHCVGGSELPTYDATNGTLTYKFDQADTCYIYFDIVTGPDGSVLAIAVGDNLAEAIVAKGTNNLMSSDNTWGIINENGYRYEGDDPSNYICFGSEAASCPADNVYRIIGAFNVEYDNNSDGTAETTGYLAKVQKNTMYGGATMVYHSTWFGTTLNSHYPNSEIYPILNTTWHDSLSSVYQNQIASVNWNLGAVQNAYTTLPVEDFYSQERGTTVNTGVTEYEKVFKIGMMYPSDYGYAVLSGNCARTTALYSYDGTANCYGLNWMHDATNHQWTMTAHIYSSYSYAFYVNTYGSVCNSNVNDSRAVRPAFYLNASVKVTGGSGTSDDPYRISL